MLGGESDARTPPFAIARVLAVVGVWSLILGAYLVYPGHVYFSLGTLAMLLLATGFVIMAFAVSQPGAPGHPAPTPRTDRGLSPPLLGSLPNSVRRVVKIDVAEEAWK